MLLSHKYSETCTSLLNEVVDELSLLSRALVFLYPVAWGYVHFTIPAAGKKTMHALRFVHMNTFSIYTYIYVCTNKYIQEGAEKFLTLRLFWKTCLEPQTSALFYWTWKTKGGCNKRGLLERCLIIGRMHFFLSIKEKKSEQCVITRGIFLLAPSYSPE